MSGRLMVGEEGESDWLRRTRMVQIEAKDELQTRVLFRRGLGRARDLLDLVC